jgi:hypothetical protein
MEPARDLRLLLDSELAALDVQPDRPFERVPLVRLWDDPHVLRPDIRLALAEHNLEPLVAVRSGGGVSSTLLRWSS